MRSAISKITRSRLFRNLAPQEGGPIRSTNYSKIAAKLSKAAQVRFKNFLFFVYRISDEKIFDLLENLDLDFGKFDRLSYILDTDSEGE